MASLIPARLTNSYDSREHKGRPMIGGFPQTLTVIAAVGAGVSGGVFFAFSSFIMKALGRLPAAEGISAMNAINRALRYLEGWKVPVEEIDEVYRAADEIFKNPKHRDRDFKKYEPGASDSKWGKVVLKAPFDAVIVERNVSEKETLLDPSVNLFQLAKVDKLLVLANAPEEKSRSYSRCGRTPACGGRFDRWESRTPTESPVRSARSVIWPTRTRTPSRSRG